MKFYVVFDTNVLVSSLLSKKSDSATVLVVDAMADGVLIPLYNQVILDEYDEVLHRNKFPFRDESIRNLLTLIRQAGISISPHATGMMLPDMDDLVFYEVVMEKRNEDDAYLITGNLKHFPSAEYIVTPAEMLEIIKQGDKNNQFTGDKKD